MPAPHPVDRDTFLRHLRKSGLVADFDALLARLPATERARDLARSLIADGVLTRFQAERLLAGRYSGFTLGQYRILGELGRGGMGRVFRAQHRTMGRQVALKVLAPHLLKTGRARELFLREVRAVSQLHHPNIVTAFDANEVDGRHFLVLEYVDGPNLDQLVRKGGPLPVPLACEYVRQVALGLQCAHLLGMVHRDVKPANLLVQKRGGAPGDPGLVKISDFGLARLHVPEEEAGQGPEMGTILAKENSVMGTPDFLSPEQARNLHDVDIRADLYSLGCTFYYVLTGQVPFPGGGSLDKLIRQGTEPHRPVPELRPEVPAGVAAVVDRLMAKRPDDRYQTPAELAAALEPFAAGGPVPWAAPGSSPYLDTLATPAGGPTAGSTPADVERVETDELAALAGPTPHRTGRRRSAGWRAAFGGVLEVARDRHVMTAVAAGAAAGLAAATLGGLVAAYLLSGR